MTGCLSLPCPDIIPSPQLWNPSKGCKARRDSSDCPVDPFPPLNVWDLHHGSGWQSSKSPLRLLILAKESVMDAIFS